MWQQFLVLALVLRTVLAGGCDVVLSLTSAAADASILLNSGPVMDCGRGVNVAVFAGDNPSQLLGTATFDTYADLTAADQFVEFVSGLSDGSIVAMVVEDEASTQFTVAQREQIATLVGAEQLQELQFRSTYAFVGTKNAAGASAPLQEALDTSTIVLEQCFSSDGGDNPTPAPAPPPAMLKFEIAFQALGLQEGCQTDCHQVFRDAILSFINGHSPKNVTSAILQVIPIFTSSTNQVTIRSVVIVRPTDLGFATPDEAYTTIINALAPAVDTGTLQEQLRALAGKARVATMHAVEVAPQTFRATPYEMISDTPPPSNKQRNGGNGDDSDNLTAGAIAGIVIAIVATVSVVSILVVRHHNKQHQPFIASLEPGMTYENPRLNSKPKDWQSKLNSWFERNSDSSV